MATDMVTNGSDVAGKVKVVLGAQWGDEGKGKLVDLLAEHADVVARCQVINRFPPNFSHFIHIFRFCQGIPDCVHVGLLLSNFEHFVPVRIRMTSLLVSNTEKDKKSKTI